MDDLKKDDQAWIKNHDFQEGEDLPEAPASATCKVESPNGFQYLFTLRARNGLDLLTKLEGFELKVLKLNWKPLDQWVKKENSQTTPTNKTKVCKCGGTMTLKEGVSKKNGKRWAGWFCENRECEPEFINFASKK